jgi:hypothetical protein
MKNSVTITLINPVQGFKAIKEIIWPWVKSMLIAEHKIQITAKVAKRSEEHSARLHAMLGWISKNVEWAGSKRDVETWKRLLVAAWGRASGESMGYLPALDGNGIDIVFRRTSELSGKEMADLIEYVYAWGSTMELNIPEPQRDPVSGQMVDMSRSPKLLESA